MPRTDRRSAGIIYSSVRYDERRRRHDGVTATSGSATAQLPPVPVDHPPSRLHSSTPACSTALIVPAVAFYNSCTDSMEAGVTPHHAGQHTVMHNAYTTDRQNSSLFNLLMGTLKPHNNGPLYSNTLIGTLAVGTVRRGLAGCCPAQSPSHCTKCNSLPINGQCTNSVLFDVAL